MTSAQVDSSINGMLRAGLQAALDAPDTNLNATFSFSKSYEDAPNPVLNLADLGVVGLPLSTRDAEAIKTRAVRPPWKRERTEVEANVRGIWELEATQVSFGNVKWYQWMNKVVLEVFEMLDVNHAASRPRCQLQKLMFYEPGSHSPPRLDAERADGVFATVVIVLPSAFTGGAAHLSHGGLSKIYDSSAESHVNTTVLAWYAGITHELKPITSGTRLALSFNLIHTTTSIRPALKANNALMSHLSQLMSAWNEDRAGPDRLLYVLDHKYSQANLKASVMMGADAQKVAILQVVANKHGFELGLANAQCILSGPAEDMGYLNQLKTCAYDTSDDSDNEDLDWMEVRKRVMIVKNLVDLEGNQISEKLDFDQANEIVPHDLMTTIERSKHDKQSYDPFETRELKRSYLRTVLVISPRHTRFKSNYTGQHGLERAGNDWYDMTESERYELAEHILLSAKYNPPLAAEILCEIANSQEDIRLWERAIRACAPAAGLGVLDHDSKLEAIERFGFAGLKQSFELMLYHEKDDDTILDFLDELSDEPWDPVDSDDERVEELFPEVEAWALAKKEEVLQRQRATVPRSTSTGTTTRPAPDTSVTQPVAKKRRVGPVNEADIIDLT